VALKHQKSINHYKSDGSRNVNEWFIYITGTYLYSGIDGRARSTYKSTSEHRGDCFDEGKIY
jgi:hypothetical protein